MEDVEGEGDVVELNQTDGRAISRYNDRKDRAAQSEVANFEVKTHKLGDASCEWVARGAEVDTGRAVDHLSTRP